MKGFALLLAVVACASAQYCNLESCNNSFYHKGPHTMCAYTAANKCKKLIASGLTQNEKNRILKLHNDLRQKVARGEETRGSPGPQPAATNMKTLVWDDEIANIAQHWADQCNYGHDKCRDTPKQHVGQNIAKSGTTGDINTINYESMVQLWYDEVQYFNNSLISEPFHSLKGANNKQVGHYTQMVWAETDKLGCGAVKYHDGIYNQVYLVCNYGPAGNFIDRNIYEAGVSGGNRRSAPFYPQPSTHRPQVQVPQHQNNPQVQTWNYRPQPQYYFKQQQQQYYYQPQPQSYSSFTFNGKPVTQQEFERLKRQYGL